jgi:hypothetical protein
VPRLREQVGAGPRLYVLTAEVLRSVLRPEDGPLNTRTCNGRDAAIAALVALSVVEPMMVTR